MSAKARREQRQRNYWLTVHWPKSSGRGVYLAEGRQQAGRGMGRGDRVLVYETRSGRPYYELDSETGETRVVHSRDGEQGIIAVAEVTSQMESHDDIKPTKYTNGTELWWRWYADTKVTNSRGFVPADEVRRALGFADGYGFRGFGDHHSGLKKIGRDVFLGLVDRFNRRSDVRIGGLTEMAQRVTRAGGGRRGSGKESQAHRLLKEFVAHDPEAVLHEPGLQTIRVEHTFPTGDRADIFLRDEVQRPIGVEIEVEQGEGQLEGLLQAVKYRHMLAVIQNFPFAESRAMLIAYALDAKIRRICRTYDVEYHEIDRQVVQDWAAQRRT